MAEFAVSDAVLDAYLTQARRDVDQGDVESIALPVAAMAAILDECSRWRHGEFWDAAMALKSRAESAEAEKEWLRAGIERVLNGYTHDAYCRHGQGADLPCECYVGDVLLDLRAVLDLVPS